MIQVLERRVSKWSETQDDGVYTPLDYAVDWIESGGTLTKLADEVGEEMKWEISRAMLTNYLISLDAPNAQRRLERARLAGAHGLNDQAIKIIDDANTSDKEQLKKAEMRANVRQWTAERWNRADLGRAPEVQVTINHNTMHLDALRRRQLASATVVQEQALPESAPSRTRLISAEGSAQDADVLADVISIEPAAS